MWLFDYVISTVIDHYELLSSVAKRILDSSKISNQKQ